MHECPQPLGIFVLHGIETCGRRTTNSARKVDEWALPTFFVSKGNMAPVDTQRDRVWALLEPLVEANGMELIYVECLRMPSRWIIRIYLDREGGITLDDCSLISDQAGDVLDVYDVSPGPYTLEVSSPGLDRPLFRDRDFLTYRGATIRVKTDRKIDGSKHFRGKLLDYLEEGCAKVLVIGVGEKTYRIPREAFVKANLEYVI